MAPALGQRIVRPQGTARGPLIERALALEVGAAPEQIDARGHLPVQEIRLGEAEIDLLRARRDREVGLDPLAAPEQIALGETDVAEGSVGGGIAGAERQLAGRALRHFDLDPGLVRARSRQGIELDGLEIAEVLDALARAPQQGRVEGVAFRHPELPADDLVQGADVAHDIDPLDVDARAFVDHVGEVDLAFGVALVGHRLDLGERVAQLADLLGQRHDRVLDLVGVVDLAGVGLQQLPQLPRLEVRHPGFDLDVAEVVALALLHGEGDDEALPVRGQLGDGRAHVEVGVAAGQVEPAQQLLVEGHPIGVIGVVRGEKAVPGGFLGLDHVAQVAVVELAIADEHDARHLGERALVDLEYEVDAVLRQLDDLGLHGRGEAAVAAVQLEDAADRVLYARARVDHARSQLQLGFQDIVLQAAITLERDAVDDRVLDHRDDQLVALAAQRHVVEQPGGEQVLERTVELGGIERIADPDGEIAAHRHRFDALVAFDLDPLESRSRPGRHPARRPPVPKRPRHRRPPTATRSRPRKPPFAASLLLPRSV